MKTKQKKHPIEIAIEGIDGAGKGILMRKAADDLKHHGFVVGCIDVPYFSLVPKFKRTNLFLNALLMKAEKRDSIFLFIILASLAAIAYLVARKKLQKKCDIILTERHPMIDVIAYAYLYSGTVGMWLAKTFLALWPKPNVIFFLTISPVEAYKRLVERGRAFQPHETVQKLGTLFILLKRQVEQFHECYFTEDNTLESFHEFWYERRISTLF